MRKPRFIVYISKDGDTITAAFDRDSVWTETALMTYLSSGDLSTMVRCSASDICEAVQIAWGQHKIITEKGLRQTVENDPGVRTLPHLWPRIIDGLVIVPEAEFVEGRKLTLDVSQ